MYALVLAKLCKIYEEHFLWVEAISFPMEPKTLILLVTLLFLLICFLVNLLQRRYSRTRMHRMLEKDESVANLLGVIDEYLGKLEFTCSFDFYGTSSPQEVGKAIHVVRNKIESTIAAMEEHLQSFQHHQRKEKRQKNQRKRLERSLQLQIGERKRRKVG
jgi:DNA integrity scanning protein DisA with diadenylate cyclase activity